MKTTFRFFILLAPLFILSCGSDDDYSNGGIPQGGSANVNANDTLANPSLARLEFPRYPYSADSKSVLLVHSTSDGYGVNYSVEWDCDKKAQRWSCYQMNKRTLAQNVRRYSSATNQYPFDPQLPADKYLSQDCFWNSGYDHGHICPSADRLYSEMANIQTFYLTNMQPQTKAFNGSLSGSESYKNSWSPWYQLEGLVRTWASRNMGRETENLYVVKGGTIEDDQVLPNRLKGEMRVPKYFFVALLLKNELGYKAVGFWMHHQGSYPAKQSVADYAVNIRTLEQNTGIDFFCNLPDDVEDHVETLPLQNVKRAWGL